MRLIKRHVLQFEKFIINSKDPNDEKSKHKEIKEKPTKSESTPDEDEESQDEPEEKEKDIVQEMNDYFKKFKI